MTKFDRQMSENQGYWDGVAARERGRLPQWNKSSVYRCKHPFNKAYGEGFWIGWYGEIPHQSAFGY